MCSSSFCLMTVAKAEVCVIAVVSVHCVVIVDFC